MEQCNIVYDTLHNMGIQFDLVEHPPAHTTEEADHYIEGKEGIRTKSLFLCNRKKTTYYLLVMEGEKQLDLKKLGELLGEKGMQFATSEKLMEKMALTPGVVSIFGILNDKEGDIKVCLSEDMLSEITVTFHPNDNTKTIFLAVADMYQFLEKMGRDYITMHIPNR